MTFYMVTLVAASCFYGIFLHSSMNHSAVDSTGNCGPFESYSKAADYAFSYLKEYVVYAELRDVVDSTIC